MSQICVLGSANYDTFLLVSHIPKPGETIEARESFLKFGGKVNKYIQGANQAVAAAKLGSKTPFLGQVGADGQEILNYIKQQGVDTTNLIQNPDCRTGHAIINLVDDKENSIIIVGGANMHYPSKKIPENFKDIIQNSQFILLQKEVPQEINQQALQIARDHKVKTVLDCGGRSDCYRQDIIQLLDFISPNQTELDRVLQDNYIEASQGVEKLLELNPSLQILLKLGEQGCQLIGKNLNIIVQSVTKLNPDILKDYQIQDTTGAGDCFTSAFFVRLSELKDENEDNFRKAMIFANSAAFLCITVVGAMNSMPQREQLDSFMQKYLKQYL